MIDYGSIFEEKVIETLKGIIVLMGLISGYSESYKNGDMKKLEESLKILFSFKKDHDILYGCEKYETLDKI